MARQGYDLQLTRYDDKGWRATLYTSGMEHSPTSATGTGWERTPCRGNGCGLGYSGTLHPSLPRSRDAIAARLYNGELRGTPIPPISSSTYDQSARPARISAGSATVPCLLTEEARDQERRAR
jgi:hypothetical protein